MVSEKRDMLAEMDWYRDKCAVFESTLKEDKIQ